MAKYPRLTGSRKISQDYTKVNEALDMIEQDVSYLEDGIIDVAKEITETQQSTAQSVNSLQTQINELVIDGDSSPAAAQAAIDANGHNYQNLKLRLDTEHTQLSEQLADTTQNMVKADDRRFNATIETRYQRRGMITIQDDDTRNELYTLLYPLMREYNLPFTSAAITRRIGTNSATITLEQYYEMQNNGVEFISHTKDHLALATLATEAEIEEQLVESKKWIMEHGGNPDYFVYPYGSVDERVYRLAYKHYKASFRVYDNGEIYKNIPPIPLMDVPRSDFNRSLESQKARMDLVAAQNGWLIINTHAFYEDFSVEKMRAIIEYALSIGLEFVTTGEGMKHFGNIVTVGKPGDSNYGGITEEGMLFGSLGIDEKIEANKYFRPVPRSQVHSGTSYTYFPQGYSYVFFNAASAAQANFPEAGTLITQKVDALNTSQRLEAYRSKRVYIRYWNSTTSAWDPFGLMSTGEALNTAELPASIYISRGYTFFHRTLNKPLWCKDNISGVVSWVDAMGNVVTL